MTVNWSRRVRIVVASNKHTLIGGQSGHPLLWKLSPHSSSFRPTSQVHQSDLRVLRDLQHFDTFSGQPLEEQCQMSRNLTLTASMTKRRPSTPAANPGTPTAAAGPLKTLRKSVSPAVAVLDATTRRSLVWRSGENLDWSFALRDSDFDIEERNKIRLYTTDEAIHFEAPFIIHGAAADNLTYRHVSVSRA